MEELFGQKNVKLVFTKKSLHISILVQTAVHAYEVLCCNYNGEIGQKMDLFITFYLRVIFEMAVTVTE